MPVSKAAPARRAATKTASKAAPRRAARVIDSTAHVVHDEANLPPELREMYGPPKLSRARGAGTTGPDDGISLHFDTSEPDAEVPMEELFSIDGEAYYIPVEFPVGYSIIYLDALDQGRDIAIGRILKLAVGKGWASLVQLANDRPQLITPAHLQRIMDIVLSKVMGSVEGAGEGN
jgi:hypothetical protein